MATTLRRASGPALTSGQATAASQDRLLIGEVSLAGVDGSARVLAGPASDGKGSYVVVAGTSNQDRTETLHEILSAFALGAPLALLLASAIGYGLSRRALRPVEAMRGRAEEIGGERSGERLPLPEADDELRALGETLNSMLERLEAALAREQEFVANASHELRTPLAILKAELELADHSDRDPAALRAAIGSALAEVDRLSRLADDLLVATRADRGQIPIRRERVDVAELVERVRLRFERALRVAGRPLGIEVPAGLRVSIDPLRTEQALGNLIDNAIRHGAGEIRVAAGEEGSGGLWIEVRDDGSGFPDGFAATAFDRFSRPAGGRGGGAGLGLAIVRALAEAHGGSAELLEGAGATVRVRFESGERPRD